MTKVLHFFVKIIMLITMLTLAQYFSTCHQLITNVKLYMINISSSEVMRTYLLIHVYIFETNFINIQYF